MNRKEWLDRKSKKGQEKKKKIKVKNYHKREKSKNKNKFNKNEKEHPLEQIVLTRDVPEIFSFMDNSEETILFFNELARELSMYMKRKFKINSKNVKKVTVDALIYLLALMKNFGISNKHYFEGNLPLDESASKTYIESGFLDYMVITKLNDNIQYNLENIRIITGTKTDAEIITTITKFAEQKLNKTRKELISLSKIFIEMMSNVYYHAYSGKSKVKSKSWYIYAEHLEDYIRIIFVDTGTGIAKTVKTNFFEKTVKFFKAEKFWGKTDVQLMKSAFDGEFRTQTNEKHRGNGLATIRELVKEPIYKNVKVISGKGQCDLLCDKIETKEYSNSILGTIYVFDLK